MILIHGYDNFIFYIAMFLKEGLRLVDEMFVKILAEVIFNLAGHSYQYPALEKQKGAADDTRSQYLKR